MSEISRDAGPIRDGVFPSRTDEGVPVKTGCRVLQVLVGLGLLCLVRPAPGLPIFCGYYGDPSDLQAFFKKTLT
ncbi:hypothetical protein [Streptosporangium sp. NPDC002607]